MILTIALWFSIVALAARSASRKRWGMFTWYMSTVALMGALIVVEVAVK